MAIHVDFTSFGQMVRGYLQAAAQRESEKIAKEAAERIAAAVATAAAQLQIEVLPSYMDVSRYTIVVEIKNVELQNVEERDIPRR